MMESLATLSHAVPTGMFDNRSIDRFLHRLFAAPGRTNDFRRLGRKLFLVATNLDTGASVTFGAPGRDDVPISKAIEASAALPGLFPPVRIGNEYFVDGALNKTLHASVALDEGIDLLLCVNPLVPFDASGATRNGRITVDKLSHGGLPVVLSQTFRAIIHSRMKVGMDKYRRQYPDADVLLFEPDREDADMFFASIFSYSQRKRLCAAAYQKTRRNLAERAERSRRSSRGTASRCGWTACRIQPRGIADVLTDPRPLNVGRARQGQRAADDARPRAHARSSRALARHGALDPLRLRAAVRSRRPWRKGNAPAAPANASSRRASSSSIAMARRGSRRRTSPTRWTSARAISTTTSATRTRSSSSCTRTSRPACCRSTPIAATGASTSTISGCGSTCCSNGCGNTGFSIAISISSRRRTRSSARGSARSSGRARRP